MIFLIYVLLLSGKWSFSDELSICVFVGISYGILPSVHSTSAHIYRHPVFVSCWTDTYYYHLTVEDSLAFIVNEYNGINLTWWSFILQQATSRLL